ncbi:MAG: histidine kinase, partial [Acidobacteriota bacterium]
MDKKLFEGIWAGIVGFSRRVADGVAQLTNWQFVLLCLLALIGAGLLESILDSRPAKRQSPPVTITINKETPQAVDKDTAADIPEPPQPSGDPLEKSLKQEILKEIQKEIDRESDVSDPPSAKSKKAKKSVKVHIGGYSKQDHVLPLAQIVFFLLIILLAVRITTRSRLRADKRVMSAEASAEMESLRRQITEAQLQTLQAQVEPHFLFNTLAAVEHLAETNPPRAAIMLRHLIAFLRGSLPDMREQNTSLGREVDLCKS